MIIYVLGEVNEAPPKRVFSVIAVNNDRAMEMESDHSMYSIRPVALSEKVCLKSMDKKT